MIVEFKVNSAPDNIDASLKIVDIQEGGNSLKRQNGNFHSIWQTKTSHYKIDLKDTDAEILSEVDYTFKSRVGDVLRIARREIALKKLLK